jgi:two-component system cell cycle response regulator DivK
MAKILIVEDELPNVEILSRLLGRQRHEVLVAGNRQDAIAQATEQRPDLILMDIGIPNAAAEVTNRDGGLEAARALKAAAATRAIPIIALSAYAMLDEKKRFLEAGCDAVQTKPYEFGPLLQTIQFHLERKPTP